MNMRKLNQFKKVFSGIQIVRSPKHRLSTFGDSQITYNLITDVPGFTDRSRIRIGEVTAEKPLIITPQSMKEKFFGFGGDANDFFDLLTSQYGEALRGLEYQFHNEPISSRVELIAPDEMVKSLSKEFDQSNETRHALITGSEKYWELALLKFIVEETMASFSSNLKELHERGFFDTEDRSLHRQKREIQQLIEKAKVDKNIIPILGKKLKEFGLFEQYQDQFFQLIKS